MLELSLRERGTPVAVLATDWHALRLEETVGELARAGIIKIERTRAAILLFPLQFVGEMRSDNVYFRIKPKNDALYNAIISLAIQYRGRNSPESRRSDHGDNFQKLAENFVRALNGCVNEGVPWSYERIEERTSRPRGKPVFSKTIEQFVARGVTHRIVAERQERRQLHDVINVVWTAYLCLPNVPGVTAPTLAQAARLIEVLDSPAVLDAREAIEAGTRLIDAGLLSSSASELIATAVALLKNEDRSGMSSILIPSANARFINMERVWETAVACLIESSSIFKGGQVELHGLADGNLRLFSNGGPKLDPDVIVAGSSGRIIVVADAKYKIIDGSEVSAIASDAYQITCYAERIGVDFGILIYLGARDGVSLLGESKSGARIFVVRISAERLCADGRQSLTNLLGPAELQIECV